jgi:hypothetical protein
MDTSFKLRFAITLMLVALLISRIVTHNRAEKEKENQKARLALKVADIQATYPLGSYLLRGQTLCTDGCDVDQLIHGDFVLNITHGKLGVTDTKTNSRRIVEFDGEFLNFGITHFGIQTDGQVFAKRITAYVGATPMLKSYIIDDDD